LPPSETGIAVHVSGCTKGCAHPASASLTIVGTAQGCGIIRNGSPHALPNAYVNMDALVAEVVHLTGRETEDA
jgi:precorrin-3B synthase